MPVHGEYFMAKAATISKKTKKPVVKPKKAVKAPKKISTVKTKAVMRKSKPAEKKGAASAKKTVKKPVTKKGTGEVVRYKCRLCGYIYSPLRGEPHNGIPKGTSFEDLPDNYVCPLCGFQGKGKVGKWGFDEWTPTRYICSVCNYIYDVKRGEPHRGIKPGTKFEDLPDDYTCPVCAQDAKIRNGYGKVLKQGFSPLEM
jgi:rubredoxin